MSDTLHALEELFLQTGMHPDCVDLDRETDRMLGQMREGLAKDRGSSLLMLPTYISAEGELPRNESAVVIDAGGTNLRCALVTFDENRSPKIDAFRNYPMPGSAGAITSDELFDTIASYTDELVKECPRAGFCFSYVFDATPQRDGRIAALCKEVTAAGIEGKYACAELEKAYLRRGIAGERRYTMLNDTVAALLGAKARHGTDGCDSYAGFILGTGMNACYVEQTDSIPKISGEGVGTPSMIVNMEAGVYTGFRQSEAERAVDANSQIPGDHMFEKMVSGGYFGSVLAETLRLVVRAGLLPETFAKEKSVDLRELTAYILHKDPQANRYEALAGDTGNREVFDRILDLSYARAAKLITVLFTSVALRSGFGSDRGRPLRIAAEGTTWYKSPLLLKWMDEYMVSYSAKQKGKYLEVVRTDDATLIGSALAALLN